MRVEGLEPPRLAAPEPKSGASANFATPAFSAVNLTLVRDGQERNASKIRALLTKAFAGCEGKIAPSQRWGCVAFGLKAQGAENGGQLVGQIFGNQARAKLAGGRLMQPSTALRRRLRTKSARQKASHDTR